MRLMLSSIYHLLIFILLQLLATLPEFGSLYAGPAGDALLSSAPRGAAAAEDLITQTAKLATGLLTDRYAASPATLAAQAERSKAKEKQDQADKAAAVAGSELDIEMANAIAMSLAGTSSADASSLTHATAPAPASDAGGNNNAATSETAPLPLQPGQPCGYIVPRSYKATIAKGNPEFSTVRFLSLLLGVFIYA